MPIQLLVCVNRRLTAVSCAAQGSEEIAAALEQGISERGLAVRLVRIHCFGRCHKGPNLRIVGKPFHDGVTLDEVADILDELESLAVCDSDSQLVRPDECR